MKIALLCPGPSLAEYRDFAGYDLRIGVNRAVTRFACDWWAAMDWPLIRDLIMHPRTWGQVIGEPNLFTREANVAAVHRLHDFPRVVRTDEIEPPCKLWAMKTAPAALVLAAHLGATRIDVFGADWTDAADFDGLRRDEAVRDSKRWELEAQIWKDVTDWLISRGVTVCRHTPEKPTP